jgi:hypothetical protein
MKEKWSKNFKASKSGSILPFANRVFVSHNIHEQDIEELKSFYGEMPFTIWVDKANLLANENIAKMGLKLLANYPLMAANINNISLLPENSAIKVTQLFSKEEIYSLWVPLVTSAYKNVSIIEFKKFVSYLLSTACSKDMRFYVGYYNDKPCATSMLIIRDGVADIHWVGTIPDYRNKGLGYAVSCFLLHEIKTIVPTAILYASVVGKPLYKKIGFTEISESHVYSSMELL